jgi:hypothetical protein
LNLIEDGLHVANTVSFCAVWSRLPP